MVMTKEEKKEKRRKYVLANRDKVKKHNHSFYMKTKKSKKYIKKRKEYSKKYQTKNKEKILIKKRAYDNKRYKDPEVRRKLLLRAYSRHLSGDISNKSCSVCGSKKDLERHHDSYDSYDFVILCRACHRDLHSKYGDLALR